MIFLEKAFRPLTDSSLYLVQYKNNYVQLFDYYNNSISLLFGHEYNRAITFMKHSFITLVGVTAAAATLFSCSKEAGINNPVPETEEITINVLAGEDTKTYVEDGTIPVVKWLSADKVQLFESMDGALAGSAESNSATISDGKASFSTTLSWAADGGSSYSYSAVYPSSSVIDTGSKILLRMPENQHLEGNNLSLDSDILFSTAEDKGSTRVADGEDVQFSFRRLGTVVRLNLKGINTDEKIRQVTVEAPVRIAGTIEYDPVTSTVDPSTLYKDAAFNTITLSVNDLTATGADVVWFRVLPESKWSVGSKVKIVVNTDKHAYRKVSTLTKEMIFPEGGLTKFGVDLSGYVVVPLSLPYSEGFEGSLDDWTFTDSDGDGYNWARYSDNVHDGSYALFSQSLNRTPDNWAISPMVQLTTDNYLSFWVRADMINRQKEHYAVYIAEVSTSGDIDVLIPETDFPFGDYVERGSDGVYQHCVIKIPAKYEGKPVVVAFRHFNCTDQLGLIIDDVEIVEGDPTPVWDAKYEDYLGEWSIDVANTLTISQKVEGVSYSISGLSGQGTATVEAKFEAGRLVIYEQKVANSRWLQGGASSLPAYPDGSAVVILQGLYDKTHNQIDIIPRHGNQYYFFIKYNHHKVDFYQSALIPDLLTPYIDNSIVKYEDYLGTWTPGVGKLTISEKVDGISYSINGWIGQRTSYQIEARFLDGRLLVYDQIIETFTETSGITELAICGIFLNSSGNQTYYGYPSGESVLFAAEYDKTANKITILPQNNFCGFSYLQFDNHELTAMGDLFEFPSEYVPYEPWPGFYLYDEDFEYDNTADWIFIDADGDGAEWYRNEGLNSYWAHSGFAYLSSASYDSNTHLPLTPDNWVFTPQITLTSNNYLSFWIGAQDPQWPGEHYAVYIIDKTPDSGNLGDCEVLLEEQEFPNGTTSPAYVETSENYQHFVIPIPSSFDGKSVHIGFRHFNCSDMFRLILDDVAITEGNPVPDSGPA